MKNKYIVIVLLLLLSSCKKEWLDVKRDKALIVPSTLQDLQLMLNYEDLTILNHVGLTQFFSDDLYIPSDVFQTLSQTERDAYLWKDDIFKYMTSINEWDGSYAQVFTANVILETLEGIARTSTNQKDWDNLKGAALNLRARALFNLVQCFAPAYSSASATSDLAVPLKVKSDILAPIARASVQQVYDQIISDLEASAKLLPNEPLYRIDASKASSYGQLARVYLFMGKYENALTNAQLCLGISNKLLDYNTLDITSYFPIVQFNPEVLHHYTTYGTWGAFVWYNGVGFTPQGIYDLYEANDLRKAIFFYDWGNGRYSFKASYNGDVSAFSGIATDEIYLIRAECNARLGKLTESMKDINTLRMNRYKTGTHVNVSASTPQVALNIVLVERRKELILRGQRWSDLKRFNRDGMNIELVRTINGVDYKLLPKDIRYVMPIPKYVIDASELKTNNR